jgi:hypothetical protein
MKGNFDWEKKYRALAYEIFEKAGIFGCELQLPKCRFGMFPTLAHSKKVRHWTSLKDACHVIKICQSCHEFIEALGNKNVITMYEIVQRVEENRGWTVYDEIVKLSTQ